MWAGVSQESRHKMTQVIACIVLNTPRTGRERRCVNVAVHLLTPALPLQGNHFLILINQRSLQSQLRISKKHIYYIKDLQPLKMHQEPVTNKKIRISYDMILFVWYSIWLPKSDFRYFPVVDNIIKIIYCSRDIWPRGQQTHNTTCNITLLSRYCKWRKSTGLIRMETQ